MTVLATLLAPLFLTAAAAAQPSPSPTVSPATPRHSVAIGTLAGSDLGTRLRTAWHGSVRATLEASERCALGPSPVDAQARGASLARSQLSAAQLLVRGAIDEAGPDGGRRLRTELIDTRTGAVLATDARHLESVSSDGLAQAAGPAVASLLGALERIPWSATVVLSTPRRIYINRGRRDGLAPGTELLVQGHEGPEIRVVVRSTQNGLAIVDVVDGDRGALVPGAILHLASPRAADDDGGEP